MARITASKANQIILYLYAQGYKAGGYKQIGNDIADYLLATGHTFANATVEKKVRSAHAGASSAWSGVLNQHTENDPIIKSMFGIDAYDLDKYTQQLGYGGIISSPRGSPYGADGGGKGRAAKGPNYNTTGWDTVNLDSIATDGVLHPDYYTKLQNLAGGTPFRDEFERGNPRYAVGSKLATYSGIVPTISAVSATPTTSTPSTATEPDEEEEEEIAAVVEAVADSIVADLVKYQETDDLSIFLKDGDAFTPVVAGERKVSTKAYAANSGVFEVTKGNVQVTMPVLSSDIGGIDLMPGAEDPAAMMKAILSKFSNIVEVLDSDGEPYEVVASPEVHFIIDADAKQVFISINNEVVPAVANAAGQAYTFNKLSVVVDEPSRSNKIIDVLLDGTALLTGKTISNELGKFNEYGFPYAGVEGLPVDCYPDHYEEGAVGAGPVEKAAGALARFIAEGGRPVRFGTGVQSITYNLDNLPESVLQPLALDFDTILDLDNQAIYFNLVMQGPNDSSNLFPGFDINTGLPEAEAVLFPDDVRNLRPINEDQKVMLQKFSGRKAGMGIKQMRIASSNLQGMADLELGVGTVNAEVYTQVEVTFEDDSVMLIPDGDERFKALDNSNEEIQGVVSLNEETDKPQIMVLTGHKGYMQEIYESIEGARRSARISDKFNRKDTNNKIVTQTAMIQQDSTYYIIMGVGDNTVVVELDMSKEE